MRRTALTALLALMVVLAGCGATSQGSPTTASTDGSTIEPTSGSYDGPTGTLAFYVSDEPAAIDDFEHLNVTITEIGLKPNVTGDDDEPEAEDENDSAEMVSTVESAGEPAESTGNASTVTSTVTTTEANDTTENSTSTTTTATTTTQTTTVTTADEPEAESEETESDEDDGENSGWITYDVDNRTVDLTQLRGANATRLANLKAPSGEYTMVFVYVSDVTGTLKNGETVNVKLPSQKLRLNSQFRLGQDAETQFVYDIAVHEAGGSGKYILKPNIGESGTQVEIQEVEQMGQGDDDEDGDSPKASEDDSMDEDQNETAEMDSEAENETAAGGHDDEKESGDGDQEESETDKGAAESTLHVEVLGNVTAGESVTISVTMDDGSAVTGAMVSVNDEEVGNTGPDGEIEYAVPSDTEDLEISVTKGKHEGELEISIEA